MEEFEVQEEQSPVIVELENSISIDELEEVLSKYFDTRDQINLQNEELKQEQYNSEIALSDKIDLLSENVAYTNNLLYVGIVLALLIYITGLFYKYLKIFI